MSTINSTATPQRYQEKELESHDDASTPLRRYFSRKRKTTIRFRDLPTEPGYIGHYSAWGFVNSLIFLTVPIVYIYIAFILLRELCMAFPNSLYASIHNYLPHLAWLVRNMEKSSLLVEVWCIIEGIFYILLKLQIQWLQLKDPLEASLSAAPMMDLVERGLLWKRMMVMMLKNQDSIEGESNNFSEFVSGWFFDAPLDAISRYDVRDFLCWSLFEGRNQEHLTGEELHQLGAFLEELEFRLSFQIYGEEDDDDELAGHCSKEERVGSSDFTLRDRDKQTDVFPSGTKKVKRPKKGKLSSSN